MKSKKRVLSVLLTFVLLMNTLCNSAFVALAGEEIPIMDAEAIGYEIRQTMAKDKTSAEIELMLTEKDGNAIQEVILPDGTCVKAENSDGVTGFRTVTENGENNIVRFTVHENGPITIKVRYLEGVKEEENPSDLFDPLKPSVTRPQAPALGVPSIPEPEPEKSPAGDSTLAPSEPPTEEPFVPAEKPTQAPVAEEPSVPAEKPTQAPVAEEPSVPAEKPTQAPAAEEPSVPEEKPTQAPSEEPSVPAAQEPPVQEEAALEAQQEQEDAAPAEEPQKAESDEISLSGLGKAVIDKVHDAFFMESYGAETSFDLSTASNSTAKEDEWKTMEISYEVKGLLPLLRAATGASVLKLADVDESKNINVGYEIDSNGDWTNFGISKAGTQYSYLDMSASLDAGAVNRVVKIYMPIGFVISSEWDSGVKQALVNERVTSQYVGNENVYTLTIKDSFTSSSLYQTFVIQQIPSTLRSRLNSAASEYNIRMVVSQSSHPDEEVGFSIPINSQDPEFELEIMNRDVVHSPAEFINGTLSGKDDGLISIYKNMAGTTTGDEYDPTRPFIVKIKKKAGTYIPEKATMTIPLPTIFDADGTERQLWDDGLSLLRVFAKDPDNAQGASYLGFANIRPVNGTYSMNLTDCINSSFGIHSNGKSKFDIAMEADELYVDIRPSLYMNHLDYDHIAANGGNPVTYSAANPVKLEYKKFDGVGIINMKDAAYVNSSEKTLLFHFANGSNTDLGFGANASNQTIVEKGLINGIAAGATSGFIREMFTKANSNDKANYAVHTNFKAEWQWGPTFSPINFRFDATGQYDGAYGKSILWTDQLYQRTLYTVEITDTQTGLTREEVVVDGAATYSPALGSHEYVSKLTVRSAVLNFLSDRYSPTFGDRNSLFAAQYKAAAQMPDHSPIPAGYKAPVTQTIGSDQSPQVANTYQVKFLEVEDNIGMSIWNNINTKTMVNQHAGIYTMGRYDYYKTNKSMLYPMDGEPYPVAKISGAGIGLVDLVDSKYQTLVGFTNENDVYIPISNDSPYNADKGSVTVNAEDYNGAVTTKYDTSRCTNVYDLREIFRETGSRYAKELFFEIRDFGDWPATTETSVTFINYLYATQIAPGYLGYDEVVGVPVKDNTTKPTYEMKIELVCNYSGHKDTTKHVRTAVGKSSNLQYGYPANNVKVSSLDHFLTTMTFIPGLTYKPNQLPKTNVIFSESFVYNETSSTMLDFEMDYKNAYIDFDGTDVDALALATGLTITSRGASQAELWNDLTVEFTTNDNTAPRRVTVSVGNISGVTNTLDKNDWYIDLSDQLGTDEYFTSIKVFLPDEAAYRWYQTNAVSLGYGYRNGYCLPPIGLGRSGPAIPRTYPASGQKIGTKDGVNSGFDQLDVKVTTYFEDIYGNSTEFTATGKTCKIAGQEMLVDRMKADLTYASTTGGSVAGGIGQGSSVKVAVKQGYRYSPTTRETSADQSVKPVFYYKVHKDFFWNGTATIWGVDCSQNTMFIPAGTTANTTGNNEYGILKIDLTDDAYNPIPRAVLNSLWNDNGQIGFQGTNYAKIDFGLAISYTAPIGDLAPITEAWMDIPYERDENGNNPETETRVYLMDTTDTTNGAPFGPQYLNDKSVDYPAKTTTPSSGVGTMLYNPVSLNLKVVKGGSVGFSLNAVGNYPSYKGAVANGKDYVAARNAQTPLFGADVTLLGADGLPTSDWIAYFPIPKEGYSIQYKQESVQKEATSEFGMVLDSIDFSGLDAMVGSGNYQVYWTDRADIPMEGLNMGQDSGEAGVYHPYSAAVDHTRITAIKLKIPNVDTGSRCKLSFQFRLEEEKTVIGTQNAYFSVAMNFKSSPTDWNGGSEGTTIVPVSYKLGDFSLEGFVWNEDDRDSLYGGTMTRALDTPAANVTMRLYKSGNGPEVAQQTVVKTNAQGKYKLVMPHDGAWEVGIDLPAGKQLVKPFVNGGDNTNTPADTESWFDRTDRRAGIQFTGNAATAVDTQKGVMAGIADRNAIGLTPGNLEIHVGDSISNTALSTPYGLPVGFHAAADASVAAVTDHGNSQATVMGLKSGKTSSQVTSEDGYDEEISDSFDIVVYANVIYDGNGHESGAVSVDSSKYYPAGTGNDTVTPAGKGSLAKSGFTFQGWSEDLNALTAQYTPGTTFQTGARTDDVKLYAVWTANRYTVDYDENHPDYNGTVPSRLHVGWSDTNFDVALPLAPTSDGYEFVGWKTPDGLTVSPTDKYSDLTADDSDGTTLVLTGEWRELNDYEVNYDVQGGSMPAGTPEAVTGLKYRDVVPTPIPVRTGYVFEGWHYGNTLVNAGSSYRSVESDSSKKEIALEARWRVAKYTVEYDTNHPDFDGTIPPKTGVEWTDANLIPNMPAGPTSDGYEFVGWKGPDGAFVTAGSKYSDLTSDDTDGTSVILKAQWRELSDYGVIYDVQGGNLPAGTPNTLTGLKYRDKVPTPTPVRAGYVFGGWRYRNTAVNTGSTYGTVEGNSSVKQITLEADWLEARYTVKYNSGNPNVVIPDKTDVKWNDTGLTAEVPDIPTEDGYGFAGWEINGRLVTPDDAYSSLTTDMTDGSFITLTGRWKELTDYRVVYKPGMGSMPAGTPGILGGLRYGDLVPLPTPTPATGGFYFVGWSYNGTWVMPGTSYRAIAGSSQTKEIELVAMWKEVTVSGGGNGGSSGKGPSAIPGQIPEPPLPLSPVVPELPKEPMMPELAEDLGFLPKTGEDSNGLLLGSIMGLMAVLLAVLELERYRNKKKQ